MPLHMRLPEWFRRAIWFLSKRFLLDQWRSHRMRRGHARVRSHGSPVGQEPQHDPAGESWSGLLADTVTHAEWYVEIIDTYCKTILIASQLRPELKEISADKIADLVAISRDLE